MLGILLECDAAFCPGAKDKFVEVVSSCQEKLRRDTTYCRHERVERAVNHTHLSSEFRLPYLSGGSSVLLLAAHARYLTLP